MGLKKEERNRIMEKIGTVQKFDDLINSLCFTDRQKDIVRLKYLRGWADADISAELGIDRKTIEKEMPFIRSLMGKVDLV